MVKEEENKSIFAQIVVPVIVGLIVGGSAPWWWTEFFNKAHWYTNLENYLAKQEWKQADLETSGLIFQDFESNASKISCSKINKIDELWQKYSNRRFGFSVQSYIYQKTGNPLGKRNQNTWPKFADRVGWRVNGNWLESYESLNLSLNAPKGHLPVFAGKKSGMRNINAITRTIKCGIGV